MSSKEMPAKPVVGQELFVVLPALEYGHPPSTRVMRVAKVGRVWAELEEHGIRVYRMALDTWQLDGQGYVSPGRAYASEKVYLDQLALNEAWKMLQNQMGAFPVRPGPGVTLEIIQQVTGLLGFPQENQS